MNLICKHLWHGFRNMTFIRRWLDMFSIVKSFLSHLIPPLIHISCSQSLVWLQPCVNRRSNPRCNAQCWADKDMQFCFGIQLSIVIRTTSIPHTASTIHVFSHLYVTPNSHMYLHFFQTTSISLKNNTPEDFPCLEQIHITNSKLKVVKPN